VCWILYYVTVKVVNCVQSNFLHVINIQFLFTALLHWPLERRYKHYLTIIPIPRLRIDIINKHLVVISLISNKLEWNNCFIKLSTSVRLSMLNFNSKWPRAKHGTPRHLMCSLSKGRKQADGLCVWTKHEKASNSITKVKNFIMNVNLWLLTEGKERFKQSIVSIYGYKKPWNGTLENGRLNKCRMFAFERTSHMYEVSVLGLMSSTFTCFPS